MHRLHADFYDREESIFAHEDLTVSPTISLGYYSSGLDDHDDQRRTLLGWGDPHVRIISLGGILDCF